MLRAHLSKYRSLMPSLALIFYLADSDFGGVTIEPERLVVHEGAVNLEAVQRAAAWCEYLESHARRIYHCVSARAFVSARLLADKLRAHKLPSRFRSRDVYRHQWTGLTSREDVRIALEVLEDLGWVVSEKVMADSEGGRPTLLYHTNPGIKTPR